jgi:hypothetical protein
VFLPAGASFRVPVPVEKPFAFGRDALGKMPDPCAAHAAIARRIEALNLEKQKIATFGLRYGYES